MRHSFFLFVFTALLPVALWADGLSDLLASKLNNRKKAQLLVDYAEAGGALLDRHTGKGAYFDDIIELICSFNHPEKTSTFLQWYDMHLRNQMASQGIATQELFDALENKTLTLKLHDQLQQRFATFHRMRYLDNMFVRVEYAVHVLLGWKRPPMKLFKLMLKDAPPHVFFHIFKHFSRYKKSSITKLLLDHYVNSGTAQRESLAGLELDPDDRTKLLDHFYALQRARVVRQLQALPIAPLALH